MRNLSFPSTPLPKAIELVEKLFQLKRRNPIDRAAAAKELGYSGITGQSAKVLSSLIQYGLLEKTGKGEVRVTSRTVAIVLPDSEKSKQSALTDAIEEFDTFQNIRERFGDALPSKSALRSYLLQSGFSDAAIPSTIRTYLLSYQYVLETNVKDDHQQ